ncbi:hypothetical protein QAD02_019385 [Eretmocerus hayati]|uniref:Uncharacterized protein n=1 Tax=Eretmocerus hayati TaxID=131215 RepID=A0ACC2PKL5_9HYME|nr:hypothetical protein QAD02_019385 [Eretmocerus hayati]
MQNVSSKWRSPKDTEQNPNKGKAGERNIRKSVRDNNNRVNKNNGDTLEDKRKTERTSSNSRRTRLSSYNQNCNPKASQRLVQLFILACSTIWLQNLNAIIANIVERLTVVIFNIGQRCGSASDTMFHCSKFNKLVTNVTSSPRINDTGTSAFEVDGRSVVALLSIGGGFSSQSICSELNMNYMSLSTHFSHISSEKQRVLDLKQKVRRRFHLNSHSELSGDEILDIMASYDGTWHLRGFALLSEVRFLIGYNTGLVVDIKILAQYYHIIVYCLSGFIRPRFS